VGRWPPPKPSSDLATVGPDPRSNQEEVEVSSRRTLILVGAIVIGLVAVLLVVNYVRGIEDRANNNAKRVDVYVAKTDIPRGTPGETASSNGSVGVAQIPQEFRPASAITTTDEIQKKVALFNIPQNTPIVQDMFVDPAQSQISFRERLKNPEHVAITISVDQVRGVAGFLVPGDEVNLMVFQTGSGAAAGSGNTAVLSSTARYLYQKVQILAVGQSTLLSPGEQTASSSSGTPTNSNGGLITFNVPPEAAQWIASAQNGGGLYLSLVANDYVPKPLPPIDAGAATLPGESGGLTPYGPLGNKD
jgi:pilus assembly protein CpaB